MTSCDLNGQVVDQAGGLVLSGSLYPVLPLIRPLETLLRSLLQRFPPVGRQAAPNNRAVFDVGWHLLPLLLPCADQIDNEQKTEVLHLPASRAGVTLTCHVVLFDYLGLANYLYCAALGTCATIVPAISISDGNRLRIRILGFDRESKSCSDGLRASADGGKGDEKSSGHYPTERHADDSPGRVVPTGQHLHGKAMGRPRLAQVLQNRQPG